MMLKYILPVLISLFFTQVNAQQALSLSDAIDKGLEKNFNIRMEKLRVEASNNLNTWGVAGRYPTISLTGTQTNIQTQIKPTSPFALPGPNRQNNLTGQLDLNWVLFNGFRVNITKSRLDELEKLSLGNSSIVVENTLQSIILGYNLALLEKERQSVRKKLLDLSRERLNLVKLRRELGSAITFDVLQEENSYLTDSSNFLIQDMNYKNAIRNLNLLMSEKINTTYELTDSLTFTGSEYDFEDLLAKMSSNNNTLKNQFINQEILRKNTSLEYANLFPAINLNLGGNGALNRLNANFRTSTGPPATDQTLVGYLNDDISQPVYNHQATQEVVNATNYGNSYGTYANISLRWTLFNGSLIRKNIENARIQEKIAILSTDQLKESLYNDLLAAHELYNLRKRLVDIARANVRAAELNLNLAQERYKNGSINSIDFRVIQNNYQNAALGNVEAIYSLIEIHTALIRLTGGIIEVYK